MDLPNSANKKYAVDGIILRQTERGPGIYELEFSCEKIPAAARPGQFLQLALPEGEQILRRPLGIAGHSAEKGTLVCFYRVAGRGTERLSKCRAGDRLNLLGPLGNGFSMEVRKPLLVGGGMGLSPLLSWVREFPGRADVLMGGRTAEEMFWQEVFAGDAREIHVTTDDGSQGRKGFAVDLLPELLRQGDYDAVLACGPEVMMQVAAAIAKEHGIPCQVSLERRMACGLGACLSCSIDGADGRRRKVCKDGPVFWAEEVFLR